MRGKATFLRGPRHIATGVLLAALWCFGATPAARAHATGENYVWLNVDTSHLEGRFEMRLPDLRKNLNIDVPEDYDAASARLVETADVVHSYILEHFAMEANGAPIAIEFTDVKLLRSDKLGHFAQYHYRTPRFDIPDELAIRNTLFFEGEGNRFHRSLICLEFNKKTGKVYSTPGAPSEGEKKRVEFTTAVFGPGNSEQTLNLNDVPGLIPIKEFVWQGVLHIWIGIDHILFLVSLLLPAVLMLGKGPRDWLPVPDFKQAFWNVIKIVTIFTVAHSLTLSLAALDLIRLPSRFVESAIALSIVLVAINNIYPLFRASTWMVILFFGLFHGLGFATVMGHLPFRMMNLVKVVFLFNIGVELGQVAIVAIVFPLIFWARKSRFYQPVVLVGGSIAIALLASWWLLERAFEL